MDHTIKQLQEQVATLEGELDEVTLALAQAWDQLVPLLRETPQQASSSKDVVPVLEAIISAVQADSGIVYLLPRGDKPQDFIALPRDAVAQSALQKNLDSLVDLERPIHVQGINTPLGDLSQWLLMPLFLNKEYAGAIGVGKAAQTPQFSALDVRTLMRMAERATSQFVAADFAESQILMAKTQHELQIAGLIQRSIQPMKSPKVPGLKIAADWQPAATVSGDAWGWVEQPSGDLACFVLDVAGKGLPAALAAVSLHTAIKFTLRLETPPVEALATINNEFYAAYTDAGIMATAAVFTVNPSTGLIEHANAGHTPTLVRQGNQWLQWQATMPPIGVVEGMSPRLQHMQFDVNDMLVCYSDGLSEIETDSGLWGTEGLIEAMPTDVVDVGASLTGLLTKAAALRKGRPAHDDQTLLGVQFSG